MKQIKYRKGYKYQLAETYTTKLDLIGYDIDTEFIKLTLIGILTIKSGYAWDGASGPTLDTPDTMRGSLEHDALYQLMRMEFLTQSVREFADNRLKETCMEDGMPEFRADYWLFGVNTFAGPSAMPKNKREVIIAP